LPEYGLLPVFAESLKAQSSAAEKQRRLCNGKNSSMTEMFRDETIFPG
jgi:hypothetical protein